MKTSQIPISLKGTQVPELEHLSYDLWELRVSVRLEDNRLAYVVFSDSIGHRMLDEGDLTEYWDPDTRSEGWLWRIEEGGWLEECAKQGKFLIHGDSACEFMVLGSNDCVNVIALSPPQVYTPKGSA